jgi:hypothetical protein
MSPNLKQKSGRTSGVTHPAACKGRQPTKNTWEGPTVARPQSIRQSRLPRSSPLSSALKFSSCQLLITPASHFLFVLCDRRAPRVGRAPRNNSTNRKTSALLHLGRKLPVCHRCSRPAERTGIAFRHPRVEASLHQQFAIFCALAALSSNFFIPHFVVIKALANVSAHCSTLDVRAARNGLIHGPLQVYPPRTAELSMNKMLLRRANEKSCTE